MYKLIKNPDGGQSISVLRNGKDSIPFAPDNTDYQAFKSAVLEQQPGNAVVEDGESFSLNTNPDASILEDADGNVMTIDEAKEYVRGLP
jgi:hypothetical protein